MTFEHEPVPPITGSATKTDGAAWLRGYVDAIHGRPPVVQPTRKTQIAYSAGYMEGRKARMNKQG